MISRETLEAVEASDTDRLLRIIDGWCGARSWQDLLDLRPHLEHALERGKQLWAVDEHIRYRLALEGPDDLAAAAVAEGPARFALGPLTEVVAQHHTWEGLAPHLGDGPHRSLVAFERALREEDLDPHDVGIPVFDIPVAPQPWEPRYAVATYKSDRGEFPAPPRPRLDWVVLPEQAGSIDDTETVESLYALTSVWVDQSSGRADVRAVEGGATEAIAALGLPRAAIARCSPADALAWMAWAAASGGAHGRRRGAAAGRYHAFWAAAALAGIDWPVEPAELERALDELEFSLWSDGDDSGWSLRLAVADPSDGLAWAISAIDTPPE